MVIFKSMENKSDLNLNSTNEYLRCCRYTLEFPKQLNFKQWLLKEVVPSTILLDDKGNSSYLPMKIVMYNTHEMDLFDINKWNSSSGENVCYDVNLFLLNSQGLPSKKFSYKNCRLIKIDYIQTLSYADNDSIIETTFHIKPTDIIITNVK